MVFSGRVCVFGRVWLVDGGEWIFLMDKWGVLDGWVSEDIYYG